MKFSNNKQNYETKKVAIIVVIVIIISLLLYCGNRFVEYEKIQNRSISNLNSQVDYLKDRLDRITDYYKFETEYNSDAYNYFAIGNSMTLVSSVGHGICSTKNDNDYFGLLVDYLKENTDEDSRVIYYRYNFSTWERAEDRNSMLELIDTFLSSDLDLVTIQLGENAYDVSTYEEDLENLIRYVKSAAPDADIILVGDFWNKERNEMRKIAATNTKVKFADLYEIIGDKDFQSSVGTKYEMEDGSEGIVSDEMVTHPGDEGMKYIADKVIEAVDQ